jgi:hypothetical protein
MHAVGQQRDSARSWLIERPVGPGLVATPAYPNTALSHGRPNAGYVYFEFDDKYKPNSDKIWRHFAYQFDEVNDELRLFLDGTMVFNVPFGAAVSAVDCVGQGKRWTLGHSHPG